MGAPGRQLPGATRPYQEWQDANPGRAADLLAACPLPLRNWEWRFVNRLAAAGREASPFAPGSSGSLASYTPDLALAAVVHPEQGLQVWDTAKRVILHRFNLNKKTGIIGIFLSPDARQVALGYLRSGDIDLFSLKDGAFKGRLQGHRLTVRHLAFSPDGTRLASGSDDRTVKIWDTATGQLQQTIQHPPGQNSIGITYVSFSPRGDFLLTAAWSEAVVRVWNAATGAPVRLLRGHTMTVREIAYCPTRPEVATVSADRTIRVWDLYTGRLKGILAGHTDSLMALAYDPAGKMLVSGGVDRTIRIWSAERFYNLNLIRGHPSSIRAVAFGPDGKTVRVADHEGTIRTWDTEAQQLATELKGHRGIISSAAFHPDGRQVAIGDQDGVRLWDCRSGRLVKGIILPAPNPAFIPATNLLRWTPDGKALFAYQRSGGAFVGDPSQGQFDRIEFVKSEILAFHLGPGPRQALIRRIRPWKVAVLDLATCAKETQLSLPANTMTCAAFSPDGSRVFTGGIDGIIRSWDVASGSLLATLPPVAKKVAALECSPDGRFLASADLGGSLRLWDCAKACQLWSASCSVTDSRHLLAFSPDSSRLIAATSNGTITLWDVATGIQALTLKDFQTRIFGKVTAISPDGKYILLAGDQTSALLLSSDSPAMAAKEGLASTSYPKP